MVQINLNSETAEIEIRMKVWALAQIVESETWQTVIYEKCKLLINEEIERRSKLIKAGQVKQMKNNYDGTP